MNSAAATVRAALEMGQIVFSDSPQVKLRLAFYQQRSSGTRVLTDFSANCIDPSALSPRKHKTRDRGASSSGCIHDSIFHVVASVNSEKRQGRASFCHKSLAACFVHTICHQHPPEDKCGLASSSSSPSPPLFSGTRSRGHGKIRTDTFRPHTTAGHTSPAQALRDTNIRQCGNSLELRMKPQKAPEKV
ncbi:hypothetical protein SRHO_G00302880 [Serrasalmus rhombeus]